MNKKRIAIFGSKGQLGVELSREFQERGCEVVRFDRSTVDIADATQVERALAGAEADVVLNAAASA